MVTRSIFKTGLNFVSLSKAPALSKGSGSTVRKAFSELLMRNEAEKLESERASDSVVSLAHSDHGQGQIFVVYVIEMSAILQISAQYTCPRFSNFGTMLAFTHLLHDLDHL